MNKKLLALAVAGAMAAPLAAQAEVTIYGVAHVSVDALDNDASGEDERDGLFVSSNSSRIGFKGSEDLGGGLKAIWQLESEVNLSDGITGMGGRNSFVGLAGGFGAVIAGRHDTPFKIIGRKVDLFADQIGDAQNLTSVGGAADEAAGWDLRADNVVAYISPSFNGLQAIVAYVAEDGGEDTDAYSLNLTYSNGPLFLGAAYEQHNEGLVDGDDEEKGFRLAASYEMGAFKVTGLYQNLSDVGGNSGEDADVWGLGAAYSFGNNVLKAQYYSADSDVDGAADMWAIGLDHNFSKSTTVYIAYAETDNDGDATYNVAAGGHGENFNNVVGDNPSGFSIGLIHKF
ncbi:MAG: porin [Gammaproteobacteria bacterium]